MNTVVRGQASHSRLPQKFGVSTLRRGALLLLLSALSLKGVTDSATAQAWEIVYLPHAIESLKHAAIPAAVLAMLTFSLLSLIGRKHLSLSIGTATCATSLGTYYLRSFEVGSGDASNLAAIAILACWMIAIYLSNNNAFRAEATRCIGLFLMAFTSASLVLLLLGYGYPVQGSSSRFFGLTPHPNTQGAYSALAFGVFLVLALAPRAEELATRGDKKVAAAFSLLSFLLVLLSGSRTAMFAAAAAACFMLPRRTIAIAVFALIMLAVVGGGLLTTFPDSPLVDAINRMADAPLDNRNAVLGSLMDDFLAFPILGAGDRSGVSASSYLTALSGTGILFGSAFICAIAITLANALRRLLSFRINRAPHADLVYCMIFFQISLLSLTEAYLFDKFGLVQLLAILAMFQIERKVAMR